MKPRFFAPALDPGRTEVVLPAEESRHLTAVMRLTPGAEVEVFDGAGVEFAAIVASVGRTGVTLRLGERLPSRAAPAVQVVLAQAVLKSQQMDDVVRDATMMGVIEIAPLLTDHVAVPPRAVAGGGAVERWRRVAVASAKQCRRATLPQIEEPVPFEAWLARRAAGLTLLLVEPSARTPARPLRTLIDVPTPELLTLVVGPEGGWSPREIDTAIEAGCLAVTLGPLTLRADAVALAALAAVNVLLASDVTARGRG